MRHCGRDAIRQQEWNRSKENWCVQGEPDPNHIRDVDDDLILFNDMTRKDNKGLLHPPNDNDIGEVPLRKFFDVSDLLSNHRIDVSQYEHCAHFQRYLPSCENSRDMLVGVLTRRDWWMYQEP